MSFRPAAAPPAILCAVGLSLLLAACGGVDPQSSGDPGKRRKVRQVRKVPARTRRQRVNLDGFRERPTQDQRGEPERDGSGPKRLQALPALGGKENLTPQEKVAREEAVLKFAKCMREHGINVHASTVGGGVRIGIERSATSGGPNPESPAFQAAQKACQGLLPLKGPPGGGPGGGPSTGTAKGGSSGAGATLSLGG